MFSDCSQIAEDIKTCQSAGKKILLSLGGASPNTVIDSDSSADSFADFLWGAFGPVQDTTLYPRPFEDAVVDGFDLDIETGGSVGYAALVNELRTRFATDSSKTYYISAAPQCVNPDPNLSDAIENSDIDYVFVPLFYFL